MEGDWERLPAEQDIGCVQRGPLLIDIPKTWLEYEWFHSSWSQRVAEEAKVIHSMNPDLVLSNISYLSIEAGAQAGCRTVGLGSLSWDQVLDRFVTDGSEPQKEIIRRIRQAYLKAAQMIRLAPGIPMVAFRNLVDVGPTYSRPVKPSGEIRSQLDVKPDERLVLVAFGGIPLESLPVDRLEQMKGYRFLIGGPERFKGYSRVFSTASLSAAFNQILAESDLVVTKPGYATVVESVNYGTPIIYVRRNNFVDEQFLVDYSHQYTRAIELSMDQFQTGDWREALDAVQAMPCPSKHPPKSGTSAAAAVLAEYF